MPAPMAKATLQAALLSAVSNLLAQFISAYQGSKPFQFDAPQFLRFVVLTFITAPPNYQWQALLERTFPAYERKQPLHDIEKQAKDHSREKDGGYNSSRRAEEKPKLNWKNTILKWFIDCITVGAILNTVAFFILMGVLKGQNTDQIAHNVWTETIPLIVAGYKIWPFASIISFSCIPVERRIVFLSFIGLLWGIYMSLVAARV